MISKTDNTREKLAEYAHSAWAGWMNYMFSFCTVDENGNCIIPKEKFDRWDRQRRTLYAQLPENEKKSDREEADKILDIIKSTEKDK